MYLWKDKKLATELKEGRISEPEKFKYFVTFFILMSFVGLYVSPQITPLVKIINSLIYLVINIIGMVLCFKQNKKIDNANFIERYFCLLLPVTIRIYVYLVGGLFLLISIAELLFTDFALSVKIKPPLNYYLGIIYSAIVIIFIYGRLLARFRELK